MQNSALNGFTEHIRAHWQQRRESIKWRSMKHPGLRSERAGGAEEARGSKRRGGRRTKETWRKNVDIGDVEEFLEEQRLDERLGKFSEKSDAELFTVDTAGVGAAAEVGGGGARLASNKQRRRAALPSIPRCYAHLESHSKVVDPNKKRNVVRAVGSRPTALSRLTVARRAHSTLQQDKERARQQDRERARQLKRQRRHTRSTFDLDVWTDVPEAKKVEPALQCEWLAGDTVHVNVPCERRVRPPPRTAPLRPPPPALPAPHPGQSYNPTYKDHQELLQAVSDKEQQLIKKEKHLERVTTRMFKHMRSDKAQSEWLEEMMVGLPPLPSLAPAAASHSDTDGEYSAINPPVQNKKKDAKTRRKQRQQRQLQLEILKRKEDKKKIADIYKLRFLESAVSRAEARASRAHEERATRRSARLAAAPPTLNAHKHRQQEEDFLAPAELSHALRTHAQHGNLLKERFESLQRRGAVAPSRVFLRKKLRLKRYFKPGHKVTAHDVARYLNNNNSSKAKSAAPQ